MPFSALGVSASLNAAAHAAGFVRATPVQRAAIGAVLGGQDVLAIAPTGSGKTAAYVLPLLDRLAASRSVSVRRRVLRALVLVPTRELVVQVARLAQAWAQPLDLRVRALFGGVSVNPQMLALRGGADLVVATPGRLLDLLERHALSIDAVQTLVLDEADRMLDGGFAAEWARIALQLPPRRQNLFFSATFAPQAQALADSMLHQPLHIRVEAPASIPAVISHNAIAVDPDMRTRLLRHLVAQYAWDRVLVFVATKFAAEIVADKLRKGGVAAEPLHGQLSQGKRSQVLADFQAGRIAVLVATDLAARGIDIPQMPVVVHYDLPRSADDYTHRSGRTGRAGKEGLALSFVCADTQPHWELICKRQGLDPVLEVVAAFEPVQSAALRLYDPQGTGGTKGKRPSKKDKLRAAALAAPGQAS
jgi:superfamily II DNA/RNA helicase